MNNNNNNNNDKEKNPKNAKLNHHCIRCASQRFMRRNSLCSMFMKKPPVALSRKEKKRKIMFTWFTTEKTKVCIIERT